jgi:hypothetical protein
MQDLFQMNLDDIGAADHSFKIASMIQAASCRAGSAFTANYDMLGGNGMININRTCHTKSNDELRPVLEQYKEVQANAGAPPFWRLKGDGGGDHNLWPQIFEELGNDVKKLRKKTIGGFPRATLPGSIDDTVQHIQSKKEANDWALATIGKVQALGRGK